MLSKFLGRFRRGKKKEEEIKHPGKPQEKTPRMLTELEKICWNDKETYQALSNVMFLDPRKTGTTMREAAENAKKAEKANDAVKAKFWYEIAGGMAIYEGDVKKVVEYFGQCQKISPDTDYSILKIPEKAVTIAQEYYKKVLGLGTGNLPEQTG